MDRPETRYAKTVDGVHIAYQVVGDGPTDIVYSAGFVSNVDIAWVEGHQEVFFRGLATLGRLIIFDRRGIGLSDRPDRVESLALELGVNDLRAVMDAAGSERAMLFGFEEGGTLAAMFAAAHPDRASALILFSPWVKGSWSPDYPWGSSGDEHAEWSRRVAEEWGTEGFARWLIGLANPGKESDDRYVAECARYHRSCSSPGMMQAIDAMNDATDARAVLPTVSAPTLTLQRTEDAMGSLDEVRYITSLIPGAKMVELQGTAHPPYVGDVDSIVRAVEGFLSGVHREEAEFDRSLASVLFTDVVGSTARAAQLGDHEWSELIERHHAIVRAMLTRYRGKEIDTAGDGFFATFDGPARAVRCAQQIIQGLEPTGLEIRAGVHTGEVRAIDRKVGGLGVVIGARVGALAGASEVLVSQTVKDLVAGSGLEFEDAGEHELKGVPDLWHLYRVVK
ncbi:MAG: adenylate/guanylate cyclase domain-containing protein [Actinomycetota bacterium]